MENNKVNNQSKQLVKFLGKVAIGAVATSILTMPVAIFLASYTYGTAKCLECMVEEEDKETFRFISDCSKDVIIGGITGGILDKTFSVGSSSITSQTTKLVGRKVGEEIAQNGVNLTSEALITTGKLISAGQKTYEVNKEWKKAKGYVKSLSELANHKNHLNDGIDYLSDCEVCNVQ